MAVNNGKWSLDEVEQYIYILLPLPQGASRTLEKLVFGFFSSLTNEKFWVEDFYTTLETVQFVEQALKGTKKVELIGQISFFFSEVAPDGWLLCDGSVKNKADYPELWDTFPSSEKTAANLTLPNLLDETYLAGKSAANAVGATFGANSHTLTVGELPAHSHSESAVQAVAGLIGEVAASVPQEAAADTGDTGGGAAHENRPKSVAALPCIFAGR